MKSFPADGTAWPQLEAEMIALKAQDYDWRAGALPSYTYYYDDALFEVQMAAYRLYAVENGLGEGLAFRSLTRMLDEIGAMVFDLFQAPADAGLSFTSGGTESLIEAVRTARNLHRSRGGAAGRRLNVVAPQTAHATLNKATEFMDIDIVRVPVGPDRRGDVGAMAAAITADTIMLFASAPCYPYGLFDPIADLGRLAQARGLWLHVDGCWGGFISPFAKALGYAIPEWDFAIPGVTSLSADIHKFGFAAKGASALIFRDRGMLDHERFVFSDWPRGTYVTPSFLGSRPAGAVASAWAVMRHFGFAGYVETTRATMAATCRLIDGVDAIPGLACLTPNREANLYAYEATDPAVDIMAVADLMQGRGWLPGRLNAPLAIHQGVNPVHLQSAGRYLDDLGAAVAEVRRTGRRGAFDARTY